MKQHFSIASLLAFLPVASTLVVSERAQTARGRLFEALSSPSGKLTLCPEIVIPDPSDPTAILLQASLIMNMSTKIRTQAKANAAFLAGALPALKTFCNEQETARGNFPSPVPAVYCGVVEDLSEIAEAGAEGLLVKICDGDEVSSADDLASDASWVDTCKLALEAGLQPIPEITVSEDDAADLDVETLVKKISEIVGEDPVSVLVTVNEEPAPADDGEETEAEEAVVEATAAPLPQVNKSLGRKIPIVGSIRATAGGGRMGTESNRFKSAGFTGALLRQECIPVISMSQDLEYLTNFWGVCIGDLKSTKSKSFNFQSRNYLEKSAPLEWMKYQKDVLDSGALGDPNDNVPTGLNPDSGDYQGF